MRYHLLVLVLVVTSFAYGRDYCGADSLPKQRLGPTTTRDWPSVHDMNLSPDGNWISYLVSNYPPGKVTLTMRGLNNHWKKEVTGTRLSILFFSPNSKKLCWSNNDSLFLQTVGKDVPYFLGFATKGVRFLKRGEWLAWQTEDDSLTIFNSITGKRMHLSDVENFEFHVSKPILIAKQYFSNGNRVKQLQWIDLPTSAIKVIWTAKHEESIRRWVFDDQGTQLTFLVDNTGKTEKQLWYYQRDTEKAVNKEIFPMQGFGLESVSSFNDEGDKLLINLKKKDIGRLETDKHNASVEVWSYKDEFLRPAQSKLSPAAYNKVWFKLPEFKPKDIDNLPQISLNMQSGCEIIMYSDSVNNNLQKWYSFWAINLSNGSKHFILKKDNPNLEYYISPDGKYVFYYTDGHYYSLCLQTGKAINLTDVIPEDIFDRQKENQPSFGIMGWDQSSQDVLIYGKFDIWRLDPSGTEQPQNITNGYGQKNNISFRAVYTNDIGWNFYKRNVQILLTALNQTTKYNGFFKIELNKNIDPQLLTMGPYTYYQVESQQGHPYSFNDGMPPLEGGKGGDKVWVVMRQSDREYPNYYYTKDFKAFKPITSFQPQKEYNWVKAELVNWTMFDGKQSQGVLYKPENFDPQKKYPVIFNYYEKLSHRVYQFPRTTLTPLFDDNIDIVWFTSKGYLVFTPDIYYSIANQPNGITVGEAAYNSVVSAARHLKQLPFVDSSHLAIQGHSFGGLQTSYLVTHSSEFVAACEMSGTTDLLTSYLTLAIGLPNDGIGKLSKQDHPQGRVGATPWERPDLYLQLSSVLHANKVTSPLLIVHNKKDEAVNFSQGVEMYMALRRLNKPCWLLQYDNSHHSMDTYEDALDYTTRLTQFFDHYLKEMPAPQWMTQGIPAYLKGVETRYELDSSGNCGKDCKVCKHYQMKQLQK